MNGRKQGKRPLGDAPESHHIAAVAHHFLAGSCRPGVQERTVQGPTVQEVAVLSWQPGPLAAYAAAGLAAAAFRIPEAKAGQPGRPAVFLEEGPGLAWSAASYLDSRHLLPGTRAGGYAGRRYWPLDLPPPSPAQCADPALRLANLGRLEADALEHLENLPAGLRRFASVLPVEDPGTPGPCPVRRLVWCLYRRDLASRRAASALGRLAALTHPVGVEILAFPDGWDGRRPPEAGRPAPSRRAGPSAGQPAEAPGDWAFTFVLGPEVAISITMLDGPPQGQDCTAGTAPGPGAGFLPVLARIRKPTPPFFRWTGDCASP